MENGRRYFLSSFAAMLAGAKAFWAAGQGQSRGQGPTSGVPRIPGPSEPIGPMDDSPFPPPPDPKAQLKQSQKNLRRDADQLLQLATELKDEAYKTEQTDVLSLSLVHKAEEVEKLAKQIKDLVRAA